jgi:hypothetical protein
MPRVRCSECHSTWDQPRNVAVPHLYEQHRDGCPSAPRPESRLEYGSREEPPDPYTSAGGTP